MNRHLYDSFASRWYRGGTVWFYADTHFGDTKIIQNRNVTDEEQLKLINSCIGKNDTIVILGDVGNIEFVKKIRGYKVLVMGNHDKGAANYKAKYVTTTITDGNGGILHQGTYNENKLFDEVYEGPVMISDKIILSHEPIANLPNYMFNIHGHIHTQHRDVKNEYKYRYLNVCAELIEYKPISINQIIKQGLLKNTENIHREAIERGKRRNGNTNC